MISEEKSLKQYAREAKKRLKQGFWQNYRNNLEKEVKRAENDGILVSKVKEFYTQKVSQEVKGRKNDDAFYLKVKKLLDEEGEVSNAIGRLTDKEYFNSLNYEQKQRYTLGLSEKYLQAVERYRKEKEVDCAY